MIEGATVWHHGYGFGVLLRLIRGSTAFKDQAEVRWDNGTVSTVLYNSVRFAHKDESRGNHERNG